MNEGEAQATALLLGLLLGYVFYKTGLYKLPMEDYFALIVATVAVPFFLFLFLRRRFR